MSSKIRLAAEAGAITFQGPTPDYVARLDYSMMISLGIAPSIRAAADRWGVSFGIARRLIEEAKAITITVEV